MVLYNRDRFANSNTYRHALANSDTDAFANANPNSNTDDLGANRPARARGR